MDSQFLAYTMNSESIRAQYTRGSTGAIQVHFNVGTARELLIAVPPVDEQRRIALELADRLAKLGRTDTALSSQLTKLREYRQSLITAAVTGQLDVTQYS